MKKVTLYLIIMLVSIKILPANAQMLDTATVAQKLHVPWEILWGPDDHIWFTERDGKISRLNTTTKKTKRIIKIADVEETGEAGLLGMALHPNFKDSSYVYVVYNYISGSVIQEKLVRYTYDVTKDTLTAPSILLDKIAGNSNHNGSRIIITPDRKILVTTGDAQNTSTSQNNAKIEGKILCLNLDGSIPSTNPIAGNMLWTKGHRNAQGLVLAPNGNLYSSEHGPNNDDELNIIVKGKNYGWPNVEGYCNTTLEKNFCNTTPVVEPIKAWTPTLAVAGIDYYDNNAIPEWKNCILMTNLKEADLRVLKLNAAGDSIIKETIYYNKIFGRLRDLCVAPNGDVYISTSNRDGRAAAPFPRVVDDRIIKIFTTVTNVNYMTASTALVTIAPNPFLEQTAINITDNAVAATHAYDLFIYDVMGKELKKQTLMNGETFLLKKDKLVKGIYFYQVYSNNQKIKTGKLVVN